MYKHKDGKIEFEKGDIVKLSEYGIKAFGEEEIGKIYLVQEIVCSGGTGGIGSIYK